LLKEPRHSGKKLVLSPRDTDIDELVPLARPGKLNRPGAGNPDIDSVFLQDFLTLAILLRAFAEKWAPLEAVHFNQLTITLESQPKDEERRMVVDGLISHNASQTGDASYERLTLLLRDPSGIVVGGLLGEVCWGWLHIDVLWVDGALRERGYGRKLMAAAEQEAVASACQEDAREIR
jgi:ribosomal protein S18 acetylase RimI-like enzyme